MDSGNILTTVQAPSQVITITADAALIAALQDIRNTLGELLAEARATNYTLSSMAPVMMAEAESRMAWHDQQTAIASILTRNAGRDGPEGAQGAEMPTAGPSPQEGAENRATGASEPEPLDWFIGADGEVFIRGTGDAPDRRATMAEKMRALAPKAMPSKKRR